MKLKYLNQKQFLTYSLISVFLAGCGGGGGSDSPLIVKDDKNSGIISTGTGDGQLDSTSTTSSKSNYKSLSAAEILTLTGAGIILGVNDTGFNVDNKPNYMLGDVYLKDMYDFTSPSSPFLNNNYTPSSSSAAHGIAMAQIISSRATDTEIIGANALDKGLSTFELYKAGIFLGDKGAKIINNSWSSAYYGGGLSDISFNVSLLQSQPFQDVFQAIHDRDLLFVMATGNDGIAEASATSRIPEIFPNFAGNFLAVTAQSEVGKEVNHCGSAKDWCLTAPLIATYFNPYNGNQYTSWGTSNSTAYVSGVLSKVQQRYSWMTASQLQRVVLGTADDIGAIGVDGVYGWGLLNESKAIKGYGTFAWGNENFNIPVNVTSYFDNNITGTGGFDKNGNGTLVLNGNNTFTGAVNVNSGTLAINGSNTSNFTIGSNGRLIVGQEPNISTFNLTNNGNLEVMNANLNVNGNFTQTANATMYANAGYQTTVAGTVDIDGRLVISSTKPGYIAPTNAPVTVLESLSSGINGNFSSLGYGNGVVKASFDNTSNEVRLKLELGSVSGATSQSTPFMGQAAAVAKTDTIMDNIQSKVNNGQSVSAEAASYYQQIAFAATPVTTMFLDGDTAIKNASQNLNIYQNDLNNSLISQAQGTNVFASYDKSKAKTTFTGINGERQAHAQLLGGSYDFQQGTTVFGQLSNGSTDWTERMGFQSNSSNIDFQGLTLGIKQKISDVNVFAFAGYNDTKTKFKSETFNGSQNFYGLGINKSFTFDNFTLTPQFIVQSLENKFSANSTVENMNSKQTTGTLSIDGKYQMNDQLSFTTSVAYDKDYSIKNNLRTNNFGTVYNDNANYLPNDRFSGSIGLNYTPVDNLIIYAKFTHSTNSNWSNKTLNTGLKWIF